MDNGTLKNLTSRNRMGILKISKIECLSSLKQPTKKILCKLSENIMYDSWKYINIEKINISSIKTR